MSPTAARAVPAEGPLINRLMAEVLAELPAIGKNSKAPAAMGGYSFRGIEDVLNVLNPILAEKGLFFTPTCLERVESLRQTSGGKPLYAVSVLVHYEWHAPDGSNLSSAVWGEGSDSGDKATQKALTSAMKYMLFEVFAINTADQAADDLDRNESDTSLTPQQQRKQGWGATPLPDGWKSFEEMDDAHQELLAGVKAMSAESQEALKAWRAEGDVPWPMDTSQFDAFLAEVSKAKGEGTPSA